MGVGPFEHVYDVDSKKFVWTKVRRKGHRKDQWNNPNRKDAIKIERRRQDYLRNFDGKTGYNMPGSAS